MDVDPEDLELLGEMIRIGDLGRSLGALCPGGKVEIAGRRFDARGEAGPIPAGVPVVLTGDDCFNLVVRPLEPGFVPANLPRFGTPVLTLEQRRTLAREQERRDELRRAEEIEAQRAQAPRIGSGVAVAWGVGLLLWQWSLTLAHPLEALLALTLAVGAGVVVSLLMWFHDDAAVASFGMIGGTVVSGVFTVPAFGLLTGVFTALGIGAAFMLLALCLSLFGMC